MNTAVDFRVVFFGLRHTEQRIYFRHPDSQSAAITQHLKIHLRLLLQQRPLGFLPYPLWHQMFQFAIGHHGTHQRHGFIGNGKSQRREASGKAGNPQYSQRVFAEGWRHMAQQAVLQVLLAVVGVDKLAVATLGHGVDGEVAAQQVVFQRDIRAEATFKTLIAVTGFSFGAGQGVFFLAVGVQEHRKIGSYLLIALL